jgi:glycine C-acetyltransferase
MNEGLTYQGGENFDLRKILLRGRRQRLGERTEFFQRFLKDLRSRDQMGCLRVIGSAADREVTVLDPAGRSTRRMLMFGSNNYLGLANHPYVREQTARAAREFGCGVGGPPLLNGYTTLHRELEERLAEFKGAEDVMLFSSGYAGNVGLVSGLAHGGDRVLYDAYSHASFVDGITISGVSSFHFPHNDLDALRALLDREREACAGDLYVGVEGVYSMDGDLPPLPDLLRLCESRGAILLLDDAHGTGTMGPGGRGTAEHFGLHRHIPVVLGTFSKTFAVTGGFVAAAKPVVDYLRFFARSYMFSASLPPPVVASVLAGLDVLECEADRVDALHRNVKYAAAALRRLGFEVDGRTPILPLIVPTDMDIRTAAREFHARGVFVNSIEYPAVPMHQQRFRISIMASHTREDIDRLAACVEEIWAEARIPRSVAV